jgi:chaperonin GroEL (HSP60 family)
MNLFTRKQVKVKRATENIVPPQEALKMFSDVFKDASRMMKCTIGPSGGNTLVTEPYATTPIFPTKDGFRVMNNHVYDDVPYEATFRMVRDLSSVVNEKVGDGTTSVVIIASAIYSEMIEYMRKHKEITPYGVKNLFDIILKEVTKILDGNYIYDIKKLSHDVKVNIYEKIATIAANNDSRIGKNVAAAYAKSGSDYTYIDIQESMNADDIMDVNVGFEITTGYIDRHMVTASDGITAEYSNPLYLIIDGPLIADDLPSLRQWIAWSLSINAPLVIIAAEYQKEIIDFLVRCRTTGFNVPSSDGQGYIQVRAPIIAIILDTRSEYGMSRLHDLECALGAKALTTNNGKLMEPPKDITDFKLLVGRSDSVTSKPHYIRIRGGGGSRAERDARIAEIEKDIDSSIDSSQHGVLEAGRIETLRRRAGMLQGEMHIVRVGGDSYKEKKNRSLIYEDAVMAVKNAIAHGVTLGGNVSIYSAIVSNITKITDNIISEFNSGTYNIMIGATTAKLRKVIRDILFIIADNSLAAFRAVFDNATNDEKFKNTIFDELKDTKSNCSTYNIMLDRFEEFDPEWSFNLERFELIKKMDGVDIGKDVKGILDVIPNLISPGNMDKEILRATFSILGLFLTSNQLITVHTKKDNRV